MNSNYIPRGYLVPFVCKGYLPFGIIWRLIKEFVVEINRIVEFEVEQ
jgi:hypothetical protein